MAWFCAIELNILQLFGVRGLGVLPDELVLCKSSLASSSSSSSDELESRIRFDTFLNTVCFSACWGESLLVCPLGPLVTKSTAVCSTFNTGLGGNFGESSLSVELLWSLADNGDFGDLGGDLDGRASTGGNRAGMNPFVTDFAGDCVLTLQSASTFSCSSSIDCDEDDDCC